MPAATLDELMGRVQHLEEALRRQCDREAIHDVLLRYARALDWLDEALLAPLFFDDAVIDYGFFKGSGRDFRPLLMQIERSVGRRFHFTSQVSIDLDGDAAEVQSYNISLATEAVSAAPPALFAQFFGFYRDRFERRDGRWAIARRKHLLVTATQFRETALDGPLGTLNPIGATSPAHPDALRAAATRPGA